ITKYNAKVVELRKDAHAGSMETELSQSSGWLDEALVQLGKEEFGAVKALVRRAEVQIDYVEAALKLKNAKSESESTQSDLKDAQGRLTALQDEIKAMEDKEAALRNK